MELLQFNEVSKRFSKKNVLENVSFTLQANECAALIGPNGSGKSTIINLMLDLLTPDGGSIKRNYRPTHDVGVMFQNDYFPENLRVREVLDLHQSYYGVKNLVDEILQSTELSSVAKSNVFSLSGGQKRRLSLAIALLVAPKLLFLDEPTNGMDVQSRELFWNQIQQLKKSERTIFVTSHNLDELNDYCDRFIFLKNGVIVKDITKAEMRNERMLVIASPTPDTVHAVCRNYGGRMAEDILFVPGAAVNDQLLSYLQEQQVNYAERFKDVKDVYREIYMQEGSGEKASR
ncbi:ABC transporter ATP-binding protein [Paenibacillus azoreducens]|uniref:ABC transporter ATP-binding protein n=1 Tax=Paenibacillus azoreducens TaxID=116718 RepID=A0A919Y7C3_9BACL|nr:ABC transporter ATP-binding protein [Paenibacillus azoreducens]GIO46296.1 ABC transporter ATP-binding protein [Paenibacillus azoreducens]